MADEQVIIGPDGVRNYFPADMPDDKIAAAMKTVYPVRKAVPARSGRPSAVPGSAGLDPKNPLGISIAPEPVNLRPKIRPTRPDMKHASPAPYSEPVHTWADPHAGVMARVGSAAKELLSGFVPAPELTDPEQSLEAKTLEAISPAALKWQQEHPDTFVGRAGAIASEFTTPMAMATMQVAGPLISKAEALITPKLTPLVEGALSRFGVAPELSAKLAPVVAKNTLYGAALAPVSGPLAAHGAQEVARGNLGAAAVDLGVAGLPLLAEGAAVRKVLRAPKRTVPASVEPVMEGGGQGAVEEGKKSGGSVTEHPGDGGSGASAQAGGRGGDAGEGGVVEVQPEAAQEEVVAPKKTPAVREKKPKFSIRKTAEPPAEDDEVLTALHKSRTAKERAVYGLGPVEPPEGVGTSHQTLLDAGRAAIAANDELGGHLARYAVEHGEPLTDHDAMTLLAYKEKLMRAHNDLAQRLDTANKADAPPDERLLLREAYDRTWEELQVVHEASRRSGSEAGRALRAYGAEILDNGNLSAVKMRAARMRGEALDPKSSAEYLELVTKYQEAQARWEEHLKTHADAAETAGEAPKTVRAARNRAAAGTELPKEFGKGNKLVTEAQMLEAKAAFKKILAGRVGSAPPPEAFPHLIKIGTYFLEGGVREFSAWAARMRSDVHDQFTDGELHYIWGHVRQSMASGASKAVGRSAAVADQLARHLGRQGATNFIEDITKSGADTDLLGKLASGEARTREENARLLEAYEKHSPVKSKAKWTPKGAVAEVAQMAAEARRNAYDMSEARKAQSAARMEAAEQKALADSEGKPAREAAAVAKKADIQSEAAAMREPAERAKRGERMEAAEQKALDASEKAAAEKPGRIAARLARKATIREETEAMREHALSLKTPAEHLDDMLKRRMGAKGAAAVRAAAGPALDKLLAGNDLTYEEQRQIGDAMTKNAKPKPTPKERAAWMGKLNDAGREARTVANLQAKLEQRRAGVPPPTRAQRAASAETLRLRGEVAKAWRDVEAKVRSERPKTKLEKLVALQRFNKLSGGPVLAHLVSYDLAYWPVETMGDAFGWVAGHLPAGEGRSLEDVAGSEGGLSLPATAQGVQATLSREAVNNAFDELKSGSDVIKALSGSVPHSEGGATSLPMRIHGALKAFVETGVFKKSYYIRSQRLAMRGEDLTNPEVRARAMFAASKDAQYATLNNDNMFSSFMNGVIGRLEQSGKNDLNANGASAREGYDAARLHFNNKVARGTGAVLRTIFPFIRIGSNFAGRIAQHTGLGVAEGALRYAAAMKRGGMSEEEADTILRAFKYGGPGAVAAVIAVAQPEWLQTSGYYGVTDKSHGRKVFHEGTVTTFGYQWPQMVSRIPLLGAIQVQKTFFDEWAETYDNVFEKALGAGARAAGGLALHAPGFQSIENLVDTLEGRNNAKVAVGREVRNDLIPQFIQQINQHYVPDVSRPENFEEAFGQGVPYWRWKLSQE